VELREYEIMFILPAEADEALVGTAVDRITKVVSTSGGEVGKIDRWGRRRFAYEIAHQTEGYYVVVRFTAEPTTAAELERTLNLADEIVRHKVLVVPEKKDKPQKHKAPSPTPACAIRVAVRINDEVVS
jgi:small subunit ribosomal protein S6